MNKLFARYRSALSYPGMARVMLAAFIACLLAGMMNLSLLLVAEQITNSYAAAGLVGGAYSVALAFAAPVWGRVVDRRGPRRPLALTIALQTGMVAGFAVVALVSGATVLLAVTAFLAGACTPPSGTVAKRVMMTVRDDQVQRTLFAMSGFFTECVFVIGPLVVAAMVLYLNPLWAVAVATLAAAVGALVLRGSGPVRELDDGHRQPDGIARAQGSWNAQQIRILVVIALGAFAIGAVQVSNVAHAQALGTSAGMFVATVAIGGVVGSFLYGGLTLPGTLPTQLVVSLAFYGALILTLMTAPGLVLSLVLLVAIGAATGPADAIEALLVGDYTPPAAQAQAFAVLTTANWVGFALGSAVGGVLIEDVTLSAGVAAAGVGALAAAALVLIPLAPVTRIAPEAATAD
jgi:MFS family permease